MPKFPKRHSRAFAPWMLSLAGLFALCNEVSAQTPSNTQDSSAQDQAAQQASPTPSPEARPVIDTNEKFLKLLAEEVDEASLRWLDTNEGKFMAIWEPDKSGQPIGAALLLHGDGESTDSPHTIRALRENLSFHGWGTLAISMPPAATEEVPSRPQQAPADASDPSPAAAAAAAENASKTDPEDQARERLRAAIAFLNQQGQFNIVIIGHGLGALRAARFIDEITAGGTTKPATKPAGSATLNRPIRAFVMVQARNKLSVDDGTILSYLKDPSLPVLDIYYGDHYLDVHDVKKRYKLARDKQFKEYFQVKLMRPTLSDNNSENRLTRRVRGFLSQHAKGVAIERRRAGG